MLRSLASALRACDCAYGEQPTGKIPIKRSMPKIFQKTLDKLKKWVYIHNYGERVLLTRSLSKKLSSCRIIYITRSRK